MIAPNRSGLLGLVSVLAPAIVGGNTVALLASEKFPLTAISFAEVLATSDVPNGVVNILTGKREELLIPFGSHMDVNAVVLCSNEKADIKTMELEAAENLKRIVKQADRVLAASPYHILDLQETKTTWHPIGV